MLSKCANPRCTAAFQYLHAGKLFLVDSDQLGPRLAPQRKAPRSVEYYWLCTECASSMTLRFQRGLGITTVPIRPAPRAAAS